MNKSLNDEDEYICIDDYPEHDFEVSGKADGIRNLIYRRCGAESWEEDFGE